MSTLTATITKEIKYNHGDYDMLLDGQYIGSRATYHEAEVELDRVVADRDFQTRIDTADMEADAAAMREEIAPIYSKLLCKRCGQVTTHIKYAKSPFPICCPCRAEDDQRDWDDAHQFATGHNLITPDPAECPDISAPQPVEDLSACERYSTPPSLALRYDKGAGTGGNPVLVIAAPADDPCAALRQALTNLVAALQNDELLHALIEYVLSYPAEPVAPLFESIFQVELQAARTALGSNAPQSPSVVCPGCGEPLSGTTFGMCSECLRTEEAAYYDPERSA